MDAPKVTARYHPACWTEAELNAWIDKNSSPGSAGIAKLKEGLGTWVLAATRGLSRAAVQRIHLDIHRHVDEETARLQRQGIGAEEALGRVIGTLGNPKKARKNYAQHYLTSPESSRVEQLSRLTSIGTVWSLFWIFWLIYLFIANGTNGASLFFLLLASFNLSDTAKGYLARLTHASPDQILSKTLWSDVFLQIAVVIVWIVQNRSHPFILNSIYNVLVIVMLGLGVIGVIEQFRGTTRLIRKLERGAV